MNSLLTDYDFTVDYTIVIVLVCFSILSAIITYFLWRRKRDRDAPLDIPFMTTEREIPNTQSNSPGTQTTQRYNQRCD